MTATLVNICAYLEHKAHDNPYRKKKIKVFEGSLRFVRYESVVDSYFETN